MQLYNLTLIITEKGQIDNSPRGVSTFSRILSDAKILETAFNIRAYSEQRIASIKLLIKRELEFGLR